MVFRPLSRHFYGDFAFILKLESSSAHSSFINWKRAPVQFLLLCSIEESQGFGTT